MKKEKIDNSIEIVYDIEFKNENIKKIFSEKKHESNWPVVYILYNKTLRSVYIGETTNFKKRMSEHLEDARKKCYNRVLYIDYRQANKSTNLEIEAALIRGMSADKYIPDNVQKCSNRYNNYYNKRNTEKIFEIIWNALRDKVGIVENVYKDMIQKNEYKYSPYINLNDKQNEVVERIISNLTENQKDGKKILIEGAAGTGKTAIALHLFKRITDYSYSDNIITEDMVNKSLDQVEKIVETFSSKKGKKYTIGYVAPMKNFCTIIRKSIKNIPGLKKKDLKYNKNYFNEDDLDVLRVYSGSELSKLYEYIKKDEKIFDLLIVDETHRLNRRYNLSNGNQYLQFDRMNKKMGLPFEKCKNDGNQLDWILKLSKNQVFFYDENQSIRSSDIPKEYIIEKLKNPTYFEKLTVQERCLGGEAYIEYVKNIFSEKPPKKRKIFQGYNIKIYDEYKEFEKKIKSMNENLNEGKAIKASGYFFDKTGTEIEGCKIDWNSTEIDWINKKNKFNEVGCIHVLGGVEADYVGVIIGDEIDYDATNKKIIVNKKKYKDVVGKKAILNDEELVKFVENIYYILLTRGLKGTFIYVRNNEMKKYLKKYF